MGNLKQYYTLKKEQAELKSKMDERQSELQQAEKAVDGAVKKTTMLGGLYTALKQKHVEVSINKDKATQK